MKQQTAKQEQLLFDLVGSESTQVIHLPYTEAFEKACVSEFGRNVSIGQKHEFWEQLLQVKPLSAATEKFSSPNNIPRNDSPPLEASVPFTVPVPQKNNVSSFQPGLFVDESGREKTGQLWREKTGQL
jgi:hypothetical protein